MEVKRNFYSNPAFCQNSELSGGRPPRALSPQGSLRLSPVGAQTIPKILDTSFDETHKYPEEDGLQEQEFYEEVVVDDKGFITDKKFVIVAQNNEGRKYIHVPQVEGRHVYGPSNDGELDTRYGFMQDDTLTRKATCYSVSQQMRSRETKLRRSLSNRYEYIPMREKDSGRIVSPTTSPQKKIYKEEGDIIRGKTPSQRYAVVDAEEETELSNKSTRYALVPVSQLSKVVPQKHLVVNPVKNRYENNQERLPLNVSQSTNPYQYFESSPQKNLPRMEYTPASPRANPIATQKLHDLLSTPKKTTVHRQFLTPQPKRRTTPPNTTSPISRESFRYASPLSQAPRVQQKLNYALNPKTLTSPEKRHTAVVSPMCSNPYQSVYSETTYSNKSESWMNLSVKKEPVQITLTIAATFMLICGTINTVLCFYMVSKEMRRQYFLDFGIISGFTCLTLGILGCRTRNVYWLPNRNYISGYLLLTVFSLLTCAGLLVLLVMQPRPGTPLADMTSGGVCGISVFSLVIALTGVVSSYCCRYPPPDNRVQHCAEGFTV